jgi:hypothetical protein
MPSRKSQNLDITMMIGNQWNGGLYPFINKDSSPSSGSAMMRVHSLADYKSIGGWAEKWAYQQVTGTVTEYVGITAHGALRNKLCEYSNDFLSDTFTSDGFLTGTSIGISVAINNGNSYGILSVGLENSDGAQYLLEGHGAPITIDDSNPAMISTIFQIVGTHAACAISFGMKNTGPSFTQSAFIFTDNTTITAATWYVRCGVGLATMVAYDTGVTVTNNIPWQFDIFHNGSIGGVTFRLSENGVVKWIQQVNTCIAISNLTPFYRFYSYNNERHDFEIDMFQMDCYRNRQVL